MGEETNDLPYDVFEGAVKGVTIVHCLVGLVVDLTSVPIVVFHITQALNASCAN